MTEESARAAMIAVGSPFGADRVAWDLLKQLGTEPDIQAQVTAGELVLLQLDRPGLALLDDLQRFAKVTLFDALLSQQYAEGAVLELTLDELAQLPKPPSSHGIGMAEALALGKALGMLPPILEIRGVVINSI